MRWKSRDCGSFGSRESSLRSLGIGLVDGWFATGGAGGGVGAAKGAAGGAMTGGGGATTAGSCGAAAVTGATGSSAVGATSVVTTLVGNDANESASSVWGDVEAC